MPLDGEGKDKVGRGLIKEGRIARHGLANCGWVGELLSLLPPSPDSLSPTGIRHIRTHTAYTHSKHQQNIFLPRPTDHVSVPSSIFLTLTPLLFPLQSFPGASPCKRSPTSPTGGRTTPTTASGFASTPYRSPSCGGSSPRRPQRDAPSPTPRRTSGTRRSSGMAVSSFLRNMLSFLVFCVNWNFCLVIYLFTGIIRDVI